jgi:hypothetical protein
VRKQKWERSLTFWRKSRLSSLCLEPIHCDHYLHRQQHEYLDLARASFSDGGARCFSGWILPETPKSSEPATGRNCHGVGTCGERDPLTVPIRFINDSSLVLARMHATELCFVTRRQVYFDNTFKVLAGPISELKLGPGEDNSYDFTLYKEWTRNSVIGAATYKCTNTKTMYEAFCNGQLTFGESVDGRQSDLGRDWWNRQVCGCARTSHGNEANGAGWNQESRHFHSMGGRL